MIKYAYILAFTAFVMIILAMAATSRSQWSLSDFFNLSASVLLIASALVAQVNELRNTKR